MSSWTGSRREVLWAGAAGVAASVFGNSAKAAANAAPAAESGKLVLPPRIKVGLCAYSYRRDLDAPGKPGKMSLFDIIDLCAKWDIDGVELTSYYFLKDDDEYINRLKKHAFTRGIDIIGTPVGTNFCRPPGPETDNDIEKVRHWVDNAVKIGAPTIRVFAGGAVKGVSKEQSFSYAVESFKKVSDYAGKHGVILVVEVHGYLTDTADDILRLTDAVDSEWFGINIDTGNFLDDTYPSIERVGPRAVTCHVKTTVHKTASKELEPADYPRIVSILRKTGYRGFISLEYEGKDPHAEVPEHIRRIKEAVRASA